MQLSAGRIRPSARYRVITTLLLAVACSHGDPFLYANEGLGGPFRSDPPVRLTYSAREDLFAAWLPDGGGLLYTYVESASASGDRCLGLLPPGGGQVHASRCGRTDGGDDSTDALAEATVVSGTRLAWVEQHGLRGRALPDYGGVMLGSLGSGPASVKLTALPYTAPGGNVHLTAANLRRLSPDRLAYIGVDLAPRPPCLNCKPDTLVLWHEVMLLNTAGGTPELLPNSDQTSSIWPDADGTGLYFTQTGDSRILHRTLAGGAPQVVHDFGGLGIARDVSVTGNRLAAVVGGNVTFNIDPLLGPLQFDSGGRLFTVDLTSGTTQELAISNMLFRRPAVAPDGQAVAVEGVDFGSSNRQPDLWLFRLP